MKFDALNYYYKQIKHKNKTKVYNKNQIKERIWINIFNLGKHRLWINIIHNIMNT